MNNNGTPLSTLAWKILWTEELGGLQSMGSLKVRHNWASSFSLFTFVHWRRKWKPPPVFLPVESQGRGNLPSMGSHRVRHDWSDLAAAAAEKYISYLFIIYVFIASPYHRYISIQCLSVMYVRKLEKYEKINRMASWVTVLIHNQVTADVMFFLF